MLFLIVLLAALIWFKAESVFFQLDLWGEGHNRASYNLFTLKCESKTLGIGTHMEMGGLLSKARRAVALMNHLSLEQG